MTVTDNTFDVTDITLKCFSEDKERLYGNYVLRQQA